MIWTDAAERRDFCKFLHLPKVFSELEILCKRPKQSEMVTDKSEVSRDRAKGKG